MQGWKYGLQILFDGGADGMNNPRLSTARLALPQKNEPGLAGYSTARAILFGQAQRMAREEKTLSYTSRR